MRGKNLARWWLLFISYSKNFPQRNDLHFVTSCDEQQFLYPLILLRGMAECQLKNRFISLKSRLAP